MGLLISQIINRKGFYKVTLLIERVLKLHFIG